MENLKINDLNLHLKELKKSINLKPKVIEGKKNKWQTEINEIEYGQTIGNKMKSKAGF